MAGDVWQHSNDGRREGGRERGKWMEGEGREGGGVGIFTHALVQQQFHFCLKHTHPYVVYFQFISIVVYVYLSVCTVHIHTYIFLYGMLCTVRILIPINKS